jgi:hypothetical protein
MFPRVYETDLADERCGDVDLVPLPQREERYFDFVNTVILSIKL